MLAVSSVPIGEPCVFEVPAFFEPNPIILFTSINEGLSLFLACSIAFDKSVKSLGSFTI